MSYAYISEEPCDHVAEDEGLVGLVVVGGRRDARHVPQVTLPLVHPDMSASQAVISSPVVAAASVEEEHTRGALNEPAAVGVLDTLLAHRLESALQRGSGLAADQHACST